MVADFENTLCMTCSAHYIFMPLTADKFSPASLYMYETGLFEIRGKFLNTHFQGNLEVNNLIHLYICIFSLNEFLWKLCPGLHMKY
jgi:hypothetical protein